MSHRQTRLERISEGSFPYWVALIEEKRTGANYDKHREFCRADALTLSRHGHSVVWEKEWYCVFRFAEQKDADRFRKEFGGEPMHPSEKGKGQTLSAVEEGDRISRNFETLTVSPNPKQFVVPSINLSGRVNP